MKEICWKTLQSTAKAEKQRLDGQYHVAGKDRLINKTCDHVDFECCAGAQVCLSWLSKACTIMAHEFKNFLYVFCGKQKIQPTYTYEDEDNEFYCEVRKLLIKASDPSF